PKFTDFNPRSPCGERQGMYKLEKPGIIISIHAPRVGSDKEHTIRSWHSRMISIHAPRVGSDQFFLLHRVCPLDNFNPRSPCGERHYFEVSLDYLTGNFNPRSPCGERPTSIWLPTPGREFQ